MSTAAHCPQCGAPLPEGILQGLCPRCVGRQAAGILAARPLPDEPTVIVPGLDLSGERVGRYRILQPIGEGGCGTVYMAEQEEPVRRRVALKVVKPGMDSREILARFEAERQALALMDHPNIARVFDGGATDAGRPFFVMELVRGIRITEYCDQENLSTAERLNLFIPVCQAIQHAHQKGIIHRDIKPSNVLVTVNDGVPVPKVIDFGIAKATGQRLTDKTVFTEFQAFLGTPAYMSPEQAEMTSLDIDTRSDIYSLGVLLYQLLTSHTPFDGAELLKAGLAEMRRIIREQEPMRPSTRLSTLRRDELSTTAQRRRSDAPRLVHLIRGDLDWIVMKCLEKDRTRRYESASGLAGDLQRHLNSEPVVARPPSAAYRFRKLVRRNKLAFAAAAAIAAAVLAGFATTLWQSSRAKAAERDTRRQLYAAQINLARSAAGEGDAVRVLELLEAHRPEGAQEELRGFEWHFLRRSVHRERATWRHAGTESSVGNVSAQAGLLAVSAPARRAGQSDVTNVEALVLHDLRSGHVRGALAFGPGSANPCLSYDGVFFSPDGRLIATVGSGSDTNQTVLAVWEVAALTQAAASHLRLVTWPGTSAGAGANLPDVGVEFPRDWPESKPVITLGLGYSNALAWAAFSPNHRWLAVSGLTTNESPECFVHVWELTSGAFAHGITNGASWGSSPLAFSPDNRFLALTRFLARTTPDDAPDGVQLWDTASWSMHTNLDVGAPVDLMEFSPDGSALAVMPGFVLSPFHAQVWNVATAQRRTFIPQRCDVMTFSTDGRRLATASGTAVQLWDAHTGGLLCSFAGHTERVDLLAFLPSGDTLVSEDASGVVKLWDVADLSEARVWRAEGRHPVGLSDDGGAAAWWDSRGDILLQRFGANPRLVVSVSTNCTIIPPVLWSPDQQFVVYREFNPTDGTYGTHRLRQISTGVELADWPSQTTEYAHRPAGTDLQADDAVAFSPDGTRLATASEFRDKLLCWRIEGQKVRDDSDPPFEGFVRQTAAIRALVFSPDVSRLALGTEEDVRIWDVATRRLVATLPTPAAVVAFSPDGLRFVTAPANVRAGRLTVWDLTKRRPLLDLGRAKVGFTAVAISPDGRTLAAATEDYKVRLWHLATGTELFSLALPTDSADRLAFTPDSRTLVAKTAREFLRWSGE